MAPLWPCTCPHRQEFRQGHSLPVSWNILWCSQLWEDRRPLRSCYKAISYLPLSHPWESVLRQFLFTSLLWWSIGLLFPPYSRIELQSIKLPSCSLIWVLCIAVIWAPLFVVNFFRVWDRNPGSLVFYILFFSLSVINKLSKFKSG